jgi:hypothetical protein
MSSVVPTLNKIQNKHYYLQKYVFVQKLLLILEAKPFAMHNFKQTSCIPNDIYKGVSHYLVWFI